MNIEKVVVGYLEENCYIISKNNNCIVIDPGSEFERINEKLKKYNVLCVLITHAHFDHVGALNELLENYKVPVYYCNKNNEVNYEKLINIEEKEYEIGEYKFKTIYTPGHRNDHMCFYFYEDKIMFSGDFLFKESIGRTDLEYGDYLDMLKSIEKIKEYDDEIEIYPGHGDKTTLKEEKINNMYF